LATGTRVFGAGNLKQPGVLNQRRLVDHGPARLRADAIDIIEQAIRAADPYEAARRLVQRQGSRLTIGPLEYDLDACRNIYLLGAGKATQGIALALEEILGERLTDGVVVLKLGEASQLGKVQVIHAAHPVPDEGSLRGGQALLELARRAQAGDLVLSAITGGSSALAILPPEGISLAEKQHLNTLLLNSGASIREINAVRKHVSQIKGGRLALEIFPAELVSLTVSDVIGDPLDYITDLTVPDTSSVSDAWATLDKYNLWEQLPDSITQHLQRGLEIESPKEFKGNYHTFVIVPGDAAFQGALNRSRSLGYETGAVADEIEGEARLEAQALVAEAEKLFREMSTERPCALLARGETTATIEGPHGEGGPNQEFALSAALTIAGREGILAASVDLDGTDGPTNACGALVDGGTVRRLVENGLDPLEALEQHASNQALESTGDLIYTGPTGTNVNDLMFVLMDRRPGQTKP
jgi:glycerate 2-kinase